MAINRSTYSLGAVLLLLCLFVQPVGVGAQCMTASTTMGTYTTGGMEVRYATKYLSGLYACAFAASNSARSCDSGTTNGTMSTVSASAYTSDFMGSVPVCSWNCNCGTVTVVPADLPIELMEFGIESE